MAGLLRLATVGSVDDGKSTLVGRLLYDTRSILADQLAAVRRASADRGSGDMDLALLTDGLRAEREQGITIDVAHRSFTTGRRGFILADAPGHVQYTRNMVTAASTAHVAIILVDARAGIVTQTRRHTAIAALLGVPHIVLAVNKMDLVGYDQAAFAAIAQDFAAYSTTVGLRDGTAIPMSALRGDNVVAPSLSMKWYSGPTLLEHLECLAIEEDHASISFRMPVQCVLRPQTASHPGYRGYAGQITSGTVRVGDGIFVAPGGARTTVTGIDGLAGPVDAAAAPMSVAVRIADDLDVARGDLLCDPDRCARVTQELRGLVCWLSERPLRAGARVLVRAGTRIVRARVQVVRHRLDVTTLTREPVTTLQLNDLAEVTIHTSEPIAVDDYRVHRGTGAFLIIDEADGSTLAGGMVGDRVAV